MNKWKLWDLSSDQQEIVAEIERIKTFCAHAFGTTPADMIKKDRHRNVKDARHVAMYFCSYFFKLNSQKVPQWIIGHYIGGKDHASVIHAIKMVNAHLLTERDFSNNMSILNKAIKQNDKSLLNSFVCKVEKADEPSSFINNNISTTKPKPVKQYVDNMPIKTYNMVRRTHLKELEARRDYLMEHIDVESIRKINEINMRILSLRKQKKELTDKDIRILQHKKYISIPIPMFI
jgi:hypothetical protein